MSIVAVYFRCAAGTQYRIYDVAFNAGELQTRPVGDPTASARLFVPQGGMNRSYNFGPNESRMLEEETLERQLRESLYLDSELFVASHATPGEDR